MAKTRILLIDDDEIHNFILSQVIREHKIPANCTTAHHGKRALDMLRKIDRNDGKYYPDIILLDLEMPVMNGFEFLEVYETEFAPRYPQTQIYTVSATLDPDERAKAKTYPSVSNFISKPLPATALREILRQYELIYR